MLPMNALRFALLGLCLAVTALGQSLRQSGLDEAFAYAGPYTGVSSADVVILPKVYADAKTAIRYERINRDLERMFAARKKTVFVVTSDREDPSSWRHSLEESAIVEFAMMGAQDIKKLKGGFTIKNPFGGPDIDAYLKSGIAWHPSYDRHLTYTIGKKASHSYAFRDGRDIFRSHVKVPIERFNARLERAVERLLDRIGF